MNLIWNIAAIIGLLTVGGLLLLIAFLAVRLSIVTRLDREMEDDWKRMERQMQQHERERRESS